MADRRINPVVIPAHAGIQAQAVASWAPAFAGVTDGGLDG